MLALIELIISPASCMKRGVVAALHDTPALDNKDLIGASNGRKAVSDDQGRAALHQMAQTLLDQGFGFRIQTRGRFVENQDPGVGQHCAGNR